MGVSQSESLFPCIPLCPLVALSYHEGEALHQRNPDVQSNGWIHVPVPYAEAGWIFSVGRVLTTRTGQTECEITRSAVLPRSK